MMCSLTMKKMLVYLLSFLFDSMFLMMTAGCQENEFGIENELREISNPYSSVSNYYIRTFVDRTRNMSGEQLRKEQGKLNAIKKAYQLTEFTFTPLDTIEKNNGFGEYLPNDEYKGVPYSSVKEIGTYVGSCVSFYTFATAIRNPRSKLYTERINERPYHGVNCRAYYGTVCSALVSYALGIDRPSYGSYDFAASDMMEEVIYTSPDDIEVADVLWKPTHVAIITDIRYDENGEVDMVEVSEAVHTGCRRQQLSREKFAKWIEYNFEKVFRYSRIGENSSYHPYPELVPVAEEVSTPICFTERLCVNNGDRSNYLVGEDVTINLFSPYDSIIVYKDATVSQKFTAGDNYQDITLKNLSFGQYEARLWHNNESESTSWIVVDYEVKYNKAERYVYFASRNATPVSMRLCNSVGSRGHSMKELFCHAFTDKEVGDKGIKIPSDRILDNYKYVQVRFMTEFGVVSTWPIKSFEQ